jgi:predicted nucleotidyltransferase
MGFAGDLFDTLKSLCALLNDEHVDYCLIGGLAVAILAQPRATEDIDLLILIEEQQIPSLVELLKKRFNVIQGKNVMHFNNATICRTILALPATEKGGIVVVDFLLAHHDIYRETLRNPLFLTVDGEKIPVARVEDLIKMKELSNRPQDLLDIEALKEAMNAQLDPIHDKH